MVGGGLGINYNIGIAEMKTNQQLQQYLGSLDLSKFDNNYEQACLYYFGLLKELDLRIITTEIEIDNIAIAYEKQKKQNKTLIVPRSKEENKGAIQKQREKINLSVFQCKAKGCNKSYDKKSALDLHEILKHKMQPSQWINNRIFNIQIKEGAQGRRANRNL